LTEGDMLRERLIEALMCDFRIDADEIYQTFSISEARLSAMFDVAVKAFPNMIQVTEDGLFIPQDARPLTRMIARVFDAYDLSKAGHSSAI